MKKAVFVTLFAIVSFISLSAEAYRQPDKRCGELTRSTFEVKGKTLIWTFAVGKRRKACTMFDLQLPLLRGIKVLGKKGMSRGGVYVERNDQLKRLTLRKRLKSGVVVFRVRISNRVWRADLLAAALNWQKFYKRNSNATTGVNITGMGGWMAELDLYAHSREWTRWARKTCRRTLTSRGSAKTQYLVYSRTWCLKRFYQAK